MFQQRLLHGACVVVGALAMLSSPLRATTYYVDDDAPADPGPYDPDVSDPMEDGSVDHPFDRVAEALVRAGAGDMVVVQPGIYYENLWHFSDVTLIGAQGPEVTILDGAGTDRVGSIGGAAIIDGFTIRNGFAGFGGGLSVRDSAVVRSCIFTGNSANMGGAADVPYAPGAQAPRFESCVFTENFAEFAGGGVRSYAAAMTYTDCVFVGNEASTGAAVYVDGAGAFMSWFERCRFVRNIAHDNLGGAVVDGGPTTYVNCVFSRHVPGMGRGTLVPVWGAEVINCTFSHNGGSAVALTSSVAAPTLRNCILWGNADGSIVNEISGHLDNVTCYDSDIEGGWTGPGSGNIDADPLFVQPGADDVRLSFGSPCVDAGGNAHVPAGVTTDIDGTERFINGVVDMGAHEGEHDGQAPAASEYGIDPGEIVILAPGGPPSAFDNDLVLFWNVNGAHDGYAIVTLREEPHPDAGGYGTPGRGLSLETNLQPGTFWARASMPVTAADLAAGPDLTVYAAGAGSWALAVSANQANAPGDDDPIGERHEDATPQVSMAIGHYGIVWSPAMEQGYVWANLDRAGDFSYGAALCPADCAQPPSGVTDVQDLLALQAEWGEGAGPFDVNDDGVVDALDFLALLAGWGACGG